MQLPTNQPNNNLPAILCSLSRKSIEIPEESQAASIIRRYEERVAIVVGGASGLGEGFCHRFANEGANVAVLDLDHKRGHSVANDFRSYGVQATFVHADVTDADSMTDALDTP